MVRILGRSGIFGLAVGGKRLFEALWASRAFRVEQFGVDHGSAHEHGEHNECIHVRNP